MKDINIKAIKINTGSSKCYALCGAAIGFLLFMWIYGIAPLAPTNVKFLYDTVDQDMMSHQLGFDFYRNDSWGHPIGQTNSYPYPVESSVINSDSIPVFAIFFKLLSPVLPSFFQYFGIWILLCFVLQGLYAALLLKEFKVDFLPAMAAVPFFICNVPLLTRCFHHCALAGQWIILLAFLLLVRQKRYSVKRLALYWSMLCGFSVLVHGYLFFMTGFLMTLGCLYRFIREKNIVRELIVFFSSVAAFFICYYEGGGFSVHTNVLVQGLGVYTFDALDLVNPIFSSFLPQIPVIITTESTIYLGLGVFVLIVVSVMLMITNKSLLNDKLKAYRFDMIFLIFSAVLCILLSMGVRGSFASHTVYDLRPYLSEKLAIALSGLRSTARFIWPLWYLGLFFVLVSICRFMRNPRLTVLLLLSCFLLQYADIVKESAGGRVRTIQTGYDSILFDNFDGVFSEDAKHFCEIGAAMIIDGAILAAKNNMTYNSSKVGRGPKNNRQIDTDTFNSGVFRDDTVYVIPDTCLNYLEPVELPEDFRVYYCGGCVVIMDEDLLIKTPGEDTVEIPKDIYYESIRRTRIEKGEPEPISNYEEI